MLTQSIAWALLFSLLIASPALADSAEEQREVAAPIATAPVELDGVALFRVRGASTFPAADRARAIAERIEKVARDPAVALESVRIVDQEQSTRINAGEQLLIEVFDADGAEENLDRRVLAKALVRVISRGIADYRRERTRAALINKTGALIGTGLAGLAALLATLWLIRRLEAVLKRRLESQPRDVAVKTFPIIRAEQLYAAAAAALRGLRAFVVMLAGFLFISYALQLYPWTRPIGADVEAWVLTPLAKLAAGFVAILPNLIFLAIWFAVVRYVLTVFRLFFATVGSSVTMRGFDPEWAEPTYRIVRVLVIAFALVVAFPYIPGSDSEAFRGLSIFFGVLFSLGSSSVIGNVIAGYTLVYRRAFRADDLIRVGDSFGFVTESRLLVTHLRTPKNEEVIVPNSQILETSVINYSSLARERKLILHTPVGIGYETPWRQVEAMLLAAAARTPGVLREPPPFVLLKSLGDFAVTYEINVYTDDPGTMARQYAELHRNVIDVFNEHAVQIMTPAYEGDPAQPKIVPKEQWFTPPARAE